MTNRKNIGMNRTNVKPYQFHQFETGSYVIHKLLVLGKYYSAWFDKEKKLVDCEVGAEHSGFAVKVGGPLWTAIQRQGALIIAREGNRG